MTYDFDNWRANMILEALQTLDTKWQSIFDGTEDEDVKADYANDMIRLHILQDSFEYKAIEEFGPGIADFSREPMPFTLPSDDEKS